MNENRTVRPLRSKALRVHAHAMTGKTKIVVLLS